MAQYQVKPIDDKAAWEAFVLASNPQTFLQSWNWGETNRYVGRKIFRLGFYDVDTLVGVCLAIKEPARRGPHLLIPAGPVIDWDNRSLVDFAIKALRDLAFREGAWFIRVRPELHDTPENHALFGGLGFRPAPMHVHAENTWVLDITPPDPETLLMGMRKTTRNLVRRSTQRTEGLTIRTSSAPQDIATLDKLQEETVDRHHFVGFSDKLFEGQIKTFGEDDQARLFITEYNGEAMVAAIIIFYGEGAYYHHSGSSDKARDIYASYFTQWKIIEEARRRGLKFYNFWGVSPNAPNEDPSQRFHGVTVFKTGFGGKRVDWLHAHDLPASPLYYLTFAFETLRRIRRRL
jgi:lipid II:glycine glycyltransferase (peptidoglycan interpeptide bridge formation enzyme)